MNGLFDLLIAVLQEARTWGPTQQIGAVLGFLTTFVIVPLAALWKWMRARESRLAKEAAIVERDLAVADKVRKELTLENERLARFEPETVLHKLQAERRDNNRRSLVRIADGYMEHHRDAFAEACRERGFLIWSSLPENSVAQDYGCLTATTDQDGATVASPQFFQGPGCHMLTDPGGVTL